MHREISHAEGAFEHQSNAALYLLTALVGLLIGIDVWPLVAGWLDPAQSFLPTWPNEFNGYRVFALAAAVLGGARALYGALDGLVQGKIGADVALAVAVVAAILPPMREALVAAEIVFVGLLGECLEAWTFERTQRAVRKIVEICPRRCWLLRDGQEVRVLVSELKVGDVVVVKPGARVPVDGVVRDGRSAVDTGALTIEAQRVAGQTVVGQVIELTARALKDKAPLERAADRLARYFLPAVLGVAVVTLLGSAYLNSDALRNARGDEWMEAARATIRPVLAVLVVSCPCALILATPAAIIAALGRLAGTGVLIKGGSALERLARVTAFAFDKTGTLTEGRLELGEVLPLPGHTEDEVLRAAATAEQRSEHLLARLLTQEAARRDLPLDPLADFLAHPGAGVTARVAAGAITDAPEGGSPTPNGGSVLVVGTGRLLQEQGVALTDDARRLLAHFDETGQTALLVARDGILLGGIGARDRLRPEAAGVLHQLRELGIRHIALLTGDRAAAARAVAEALGIDEVHAELLPAQNAEVVERWQSGAGPPPPH